MVDVFSSMISLAMFEVNFISSNLNVGCSRMKLFNFELDFLYISNDVYANKLITFNLKLLSVTYFGKIDQSLVVFHVCEEFRRKDSR